MSSGLPADLGYSRGACQQGATGGGYQAGGPVLPLPPLLLDPEEARRKWPSACGLGRRWQHRRVSAESGAERP